MSSVVASLEGRVYTDGFGVHFTRAPHALPGYWDDLLNSGVRVVLLARRCSERISGAQAVDPRLDLRILPDFGPSLRALPVAPTLLRGIWTATGTHPSVVFLRVPGLVALMTCLVAAVRRKRIVAHVVGDSDGVAQELTSGRLPRALLATAFRWWLRALYAKAVAIFYVDGSQKPRRQSVRRSTKWIQKRNVVLDALDIRPEPRKAPSHGTLPTILTAGTQEKLYKGHDTLIEAAALCARTGTPIKLVIAGDGRFHNQLVEMARRRLPVGGVTFLGHVPGAVQLRTVMEAADIFALPSRTEGYPRVLLEAMATGLPCVATAVGAIPELLPPEVLVPPGDPHLLAEAISRLVHDRDAYEAASDRNLKRAQAAYDEQLIENERFAEVLRFWASR